ncbi:MAG: DUF2156 domain-containing protein [Ornithinimicrobium sp.]
MPTVVKQVRARRWRRLAPALLVALTGIANAVTGLFPQVGVELAELTGATTRLGIVLTGRVAAVELGIALLVLARFLARGYSQAWRLGVLLTALGTLLGLLRGHITIAVLLSAVALMLLLMTRDTFRLRGPGSRLARWWVPVGMAAGLVGFALVGYAEIDQLAPAPVGDRLAVIGRTLLFLPGGVDVERTLVEAYALALHIGSLLLVLAVLWAIRPGAGRQMADRDDIRRFSCRYGTTGTAPLLALPDNHLLELDNGRAWAAVGIRGRTAVSLGAPVSEPGRELAALEELTTYCEENGWTPALLALDIAQNEMAVAVGYTTLQIGVEAVLDVAEFSTAGKRRSNIRHSASRARRENVTVIPYTGPARSTARTEQLAQVSSQWLQDKGGPELGFTLGRFDPDRLDDQEVYVAIHHIDTPTERVVAFVTWLPFNNGQDAVLDLMRRAQDCPPGVMELLMVESVAHFAVFGRVRASLGGVPLADDPATSTDESQDTARRAIGWLYEHGGDVYDARNLLRFKDKFAPRWEPMFLAYPTRADLPQITLGIARAFLPPGAVREAFRTRRSKVKAAKASG